MAEDDRAEDMDDRSKDDQAEEKDEYSRTEDEDEDNRSRTKTRTNGPKARTTCMRANNLVDDDRRVK